MTTDFMIKIMLHSPPPHKQAGGMGRERGGSDEQHSRLVMGRTDGREAITNHHHPQHPDSIFYYTQFRIYLILCSVLLSLSLSSLGDSLLSLLIFRIYSRNLGTTIMYRLLAITAVYESIGQLAAQQAIKGGTRKRMGQSRRN